MQISLTNLVSEQKFLWITNFKMRLVIYFEKKKLLKLPPLMKEFYVHLLYLSVSTRTVIGQFSRPYSTVRPAKFNSLF